MKNRNLFHRAKKHYMILLEVLIALMLITLCMFPLIVPHVDLLKAHTQVSNSMKLDHLANQLYADVLDRLQRNEIPWNAIQSKNALPIDAAMLQRVGYKDNAPIIGTYQFEEVHAKPTEEEKRKQAGWVLHLTKLTFNFTSPQNKKELKFPFQLCIARMLASEGYSTPKQEEEPEKSKKSEKEDKKPAKKNAKEK